MNAVTFEIPDDIRNRIDRIAEVRGVSVEALLSDMTANAVEEFEAHQLFLDMGKQGAAEIEEALALLRR